MVLIFFASKKASIAFFLISFAFCLAFLYISKYIVSCVFISTGSVFSAILSKLFNSTQPSLVHWIVSKLLIKYLKELSLLFDLLLFELSIVNSSDCPKYSWLFVFEIFFYK